MAQENDMQNPAALDKPTETQATAPVEDKPVEGAAEAAAETPAIEPAGEAQAEGEAPTSEDLSDVISLLNEIDTLNGGTGEITDIPGNLAGSVRFVVEKLVALRDAFEDPLLKEVIDDMVDQKEDGQMPSLLVAVARVLPAEEIQNLADSEDYASAQEGVRTKLSKAEEGKKADDELYSKFQRSEQNVKEYVAEMGYGPEEESRLYETVSMLRDIFADGEISKEELAKIDKMNNYDADMAALQSQIPEEPTKEVLPDKASIEAQMAPPSNRTAPAQPRNSIEKMAQTMPAMTDITQVGKRKFVR